MRRTSTDNFSFSAAWSRPVPNHGRVQLGTCQNLARFVLGWDPTASWLASIALSTTSMAVVYAVMLESGPGRQAD